MISAVVITKNEESKIAGCLESVRWADEIIVVDDYSADDTVNICKKYTGKVFQNRFHSYSAQKSFAFSKACKDWIFSIDADETASDALKDEILKISSDGSAAVCGYYLPRKTFFLGKWIAHCGWYPDYQLRFFRNGRWRMKDARVHEAIEVMGKAGYLREPLLHYSYLSICEYVGRMNKYTSLAAQQMHEDGIKLDLKKIKAIAAGKAIKTFWKMYVVRRGYKDGMQGFLVSIFSSVYKLMVYAKYWQLKTAENEKICA